MQLKLIPARPWYGSTQETEKAGLKRLGFSFEKNGMVSGYVMKEFDSLDNLMCLAAMYGKLTIEMKPDAITVTLGE